MLARIPSLFTLTPALLLTIGPSRVRTDRYGPLSKRRLCPALHASDDWAGPQIGCMDMFMRGYRLRHPGEGVINAENENPSRQNVKIWYGHLCTRSAGTE